MLVDYHFHPNLSKYAGRAKRKCARIWRYWQEQGLDVVIVTEHVFKNPRRAFQLLQATRPADATTIIFPGIEALTKEGLDVIAFAQTETIFDHRLLMIPKQLDVFAMAEYIRSQPDLYGSIAHPFSIGNSGIVRQLGAAEAQRAISMMGGVEIHNVCFNGSIRLLDRLHLSGLIPKKRLMMQHTTNLPQQFYDRPEVTLYTSGSDAHTLVEIGSGVNVPVKPQASPDQIFQAVATNQSTDLHEFHRRVHPLFDIYKIYSIITEMSIKAFRLYEGRVYQNDDQFTNYYSEAEKEAVLELQRQGSVIFKPILNFLTYFGVEPLHTHIVACAAIIWTIVTIQRPTWSLIGLIVYGITISGAEALARYQHTESESTAITQIVIQHVLLSSFVLLALGWHWGRGLWGALYLLLYTVMLWLIITLNKVGEPIRLIIRSKFIVIAVVYLFVLTKLNLINAVLIGFSGYMVLANVWMFYKLRRGLNQATAKG